MVDDYMEDKVLDKIKEEMGIEKFDDTKILINTDDNLSYNIDILLTYVIKGGNKFYPRLFLDHELYEE